jgi:hypothetical protein
MSSQISNPFSTGGGGGFFEAKVQASFLLQLLIGGRVPCLPGGRTQSVRLQAKQAGFNTDDVVITLRTDYGTDHRLLAQIRHHAAITTSDEEFCDAMAGAWSDFNNPKAFVKHRDAMALITGPQSDRVLHHVRPLLDWARTSATGIEFAGKVATARFSSDQKRAYLQVFKDLLTKVADIAPTEDVLWEFLKHFYLLSYDFDVQGSKDEAAVLTVLELARNTPSGLDAQGIWEALIVQAQEWNKTAGTFTALDISERLRSSVQPRRSKVQQEAVSIMQEHSALILGDIRTELAPGIQLPRTAAMDILADAIELSRVVLVQGAPGSGKSAIVKMFIDTLPNGIVPFVFKAQEFNHPHLHQFMTSIGIELSVAQFRCEFALLPRKLLVVDGAERLFELSYHEAFRHFIQQLSDDESWTVVITCRDHSAQMLREHFLAQWGSEVTTVTIPTLSNEELRWVSDWVPQLAPLIANQRLTRLLRLPFILSLAWKAFPASTDSEVVADINERQFKDIVWRDFVERAAQKQGGLPIKRGRCLISVSVERARRMSLFVSREGQDAEAINALSDDGILIQSNAGGLAPAHDVLEDWAVSRFIAQEFEAKSGEPLQFLEAVGMEPAVRRGFRLWLADDLAAPNNQQVMNFILTAFRDVELPLVWRDEIAVSVLQSENAGEFIKGLERLLIADDRALYRRLVLVLRTACKGPNESLLSMLGLATFRSHEVLKSVFVVPLGSGWRELILLTRRNLAAFDLEEADTVIGLLKDWSQGISATEPLPSEAQAVAQICIKYWGLLTVPNLYAGKLDVEFLELLFKIPHAAPNEVTALIRSAVANDLARGFHSRTVLEHVVKSIDCLPLCVHFPDLVIEVAETTWRLHPEDKSRYEMHPDLEECFAFASSVRFNYYPESALQGPFTFLLSWHPDKGVGFIVRLTNQAVLSYSESRLGNEACTVQLPTATGSRDLVTSRRLWLLYRGMMPGPNVLECALMALEAWLLSQAKQGNNIREYFRSILDTSTSAATLGVLASVAVAYPEAVGEEVLPLLGVQEFIRLDFERSHQERFHVTDMRSSLGIPTGGADELYHQERKDSAILPHRKNNLEELSFRLQWTPLRERVWSVLDNFYKNLPPEEEQSEAHKVWRIALHRMDARHFKMEEGKEPGQVMLVPSEPSIDLQQYIITAEENFAPLNRRMSLARWGMMRFRGESQVTDAFPDWNDAFREAQALSKQPSSESDDETSLSGSGPSFVAAYLIRDHYAELDSTEIEWCRRIVMKEVLRTDTERTLDNRVARNPFEGSRPCAGVVPLLLKSRVDSQTRTQIEECLAVAVTHVNREVRDYAAAGVHNWLWEIDSELAKACVGGLFELSGTENLIRRAEQPRRWNEFSQERLERLILEAILDIRARIVRRDSTIALTTPAVDLETLDWPELSNALGMIEPMTNDQGLCAFVMAFLAGVLHQAEAAEAWKSDHGREVSYEFRHAFNRMFARYVLARPVEEAVRIGRQLREYVDRCPEYLCGLLEQLPYEEDRVRSGEVFWTIWKSVSEQIFKHPLLRGSSRIWRYGKMRKLVRILLFADITWKEGVRHWEPVSVNKDFIESATIAVGNTPAGFGAMLSLLSSVGQVFLPDAIKWLADSVTRANGRNLLGDPDAEFQVEVLLRKACYDYGTTIRQQPDLHRSVIFLLDKLVERGSHTGFRLRDYIISPLPTAVEA